MSKEISEFGKSGLNHVEDIEMSPTNSLGKQDADAIMSALQSEAEAGTLAEKEMTVREALRKWPMAILWAVVFGASIVMEGYDTALLGAFWGYPTFAKKYGHAYTSEGVVKYQVSASWQAGVSSGGACFSIIGVLLGGTAVQRFGYRPVFIVSLLSMLAMIFGTVFSQNIATLAVAEYLLQLPWGAFSSLGPAYASEIAPVALRGFLTTYINLCWVIGQLIATGVVKALLTRTDQWGYRIPFAIQWVWPIPILLAVMLAPESPWHLVRTGQIDKARRALKRTCREDRGVNVENHLSMMIHTNELEKKIGQGTSYLECFTGIDRRRTEVSCMAWGCQQFCGSGFAGQATYFFTVAGMSEAVAYDLGVGTYALGFCGTVLSWFLMTYYGRRSIYLAGSAVMCLLMLGIGIAAVPSNNEVALYSQSGLMLAFVFVYDLTVGPVAYSLVSELSSTRLRAKTVGIARCFYNIIGIIISTVQPYLINPTAANLEGKIGFIWAGICGLSLVWIYFRLPEPKGRTYEELDIMFQKKLPARQFKSYQVEKLDI